MVILRPQPCTGVRVLVGDGNAVLVEVPVEVAVVVSVMVGATVGTGVAVGSDAAAGGSSPPAGSPCVGVGFLDRVAAAVSDGVGIEVGWSVSVEDGVLVHVMVAVRVRKSIGEKKGVSAIIVADA